MVSNDTVPFVVREVDANTHYRAVPYVHDQTIAIVAALLCNHHQQQQ